MFKLFKRCVNDVLYLDTALNEVYEKQQNTCKYESSTSDCSLVQQLKEKQAAKKEIDNYIKAYENNSPSTTQYLRKFFLMLLESNGFEMDYYYRRAERMFEYNYANIIFERAIHDLSVDDVNNLTSEIISLKQKACILTAKREESNILNKEIADIKEKLGIE